MRTVRQGIGFYPFWFWNCRLTREEVDWQVAQMAAQGVCGFFSHPRQGLGLPYLSESFLAMVDHAIAAAGRHGLDVHLYDEFPYPSGAAGGATVMGEPGLMATSLVMRQYDVDGGKVRLELPKGKHLCLKAYAKGRDGSVDWTTGCEAVHGGDARTLCKTLWREPGAGHRVDVCR